MNFIKRLLPLLVFILIGVNCIADGIKDKYKTDAATGVKYLFFKQDKKAPKPSMGDIAFVRLVYKREDDSVLYDSHTDGQPDSNSIIPLTLKADFHGSLEEGIAMMQTGDSASFLVSADSIYLKIFKLKALPTFIKKDSYLKFYIKLVKFESQSQLRNEQYALIEKRRIYMQGLKNAEADSIHKYLTDKNILVKPTMVDSLYILQRTGTIGKPINEGDSVEIKYTGMFLNGNIFDQSDNGDGTAGTVKFLYRHNAKLTKGWLYILETMHEGETVRFLLPSSLAYGSYGSGKNIGPYTPLIFEIKVVKVSSPFDK